MVQLRRKSDGSRTWVMEGETLQERLAERVTIFNFHARKDNDINLDARFTAELLAMQTRDLLAIALQQEKELRELRTIAEEFVVFKAEMLAELKALKEPDNKRLDKPHFKAPAAPKSKNSNKP